MTEGFVGTRESLETGTVARVIDFRAQAWAPYDVVSARDERELLSCYLGKLGTVVQVDDRDMPFILRFSEGSRVPMSEMRFHAAEVETA